MGHGQQMQSRRTERAYRRCDRPRVCPGWQDFLYRQPGQDHAAQWDLSTGKEILGTLRERPTSLCASRYPPTVRAWPRAAAIITFTFGYSEDGKPLHILKGLGGNVYFVTFTPDGKTLIAGGDDTVVRQWSLENGKEIRSFGGTAPAPDVPWCVRAATLTEDGKRLLTGGVKCPGVCLGSGKETAIAALHGS